MNSGLIWPRSLDICLKRMQMSEISGPLDVLVLIDRNGQAVDVTVLQDTSYAKCLSDFLKAFSYPKPPIVNELGIYPVYVESNIN